MSNVLIKALMAGNYIADGSWARKWFIVLIIYTESSLIICVFSVENKHRLCVWDKNKTKSDYINTTKFEIKYIQ